LRDVLPVLSNATHLSPTQTAQDGKTVPKKRNG
jgi:hypothetical protein